MLSSAQRVGRFARGMNEGESQLRAGVASSEAAFHRAGFGGAAAKMQNALTPFFSAYLNSMEQTVRGQLGGLIPRLTGGKDLNQTITGEAFNGLQFSAKAIGIITLPMLANWYQNKDKPWYKAAFEGQKDNGLLFHIGPDDGGHTIFFKYPPLISLLYGGIPRRMVAAYYEDNPHELDHMGESLGASLLPTGGLLTYNVFLPIVEHMANHSFFRDSPLTSDGVAKAMAPEQYTNYSSQTAINLSKFVNDIPILKGAHLSPIDIDNYMQGWGPGLGTAAVKASEMALGANKHAPTPTLEDWPLLSSFFERYPSSNSQQMKDFEERMRDFDAVHASLRKTLEQGDLSRFQEIAGQNPTASAAHAMRLRGEPLPNNAAEFSSTLRTAVKGADIPDARTILEADVAMKNGRQYVANVYANDKLSPNDKRQLITQAYSQLQVIAEKGIAAMDKAGL